MVIKLAILLAATTLAFAESVPAWIPRGILYVETRSSYREDGTIRYVDKRRGGSGERGAFQITRCAFEQVRCRGEQYWRVEVDTAFAEEIACRYLKWLYDNSARGDWDLAIQYYNAGPRKASPSYLLAVKIAAGKIQ